MAAALGIGSAAQASVLYDGLGENVLAWAPINSGGAAAQSFITGDQAATFESVTLSMYEWEPIGGFAVHIYDATGAGNAPGSLLATLSGNDSPGSGNYDYTGTLTLSPNTTYWVEADVTLASGASYEWSASSDAPTLGSQIGFAHSNDTVTWSHNTGVNLLMQVNASPALVPEPSSLALLAVGCAGLLLRRRQRG